MKAPAPIALLALAAASFASAPDSASSLGKELAEELKASFSDGGMQRWQEAMTPQKAHAFLADKLAGEWTTTATINGHGGPETQSTWRSSAKPTMGGRYIEQRATGSMMGTPTESLMILGYDNVRKLFHATMYDTMGTGVRTLWGNLDQTGSVLTLVGEMDEPMSGEIGKSFLVSWTFHEDGAHDYVIKELIYGDAITVVTARSERRRE